MSSTVENSSIIEDDGERARKRVKRERAASESERCSKGAMKSQGREGGIPVMSGQARARCEKGSVVSASQFRPVIGSDSVLTLNASPRYTLAQRAGDRGGRRGGGF